MKHLHWLTASTFSLLTLRFSLILAGLAACARADDDLYPAGKIQGHIHLNPASGKYTLDNSGISVRSGTIVWDCTATDSVSGVFALATAYERLDWGDIDPATASAITQFDFGYCTNAYTPDISNGNLEMHLAIYINENGHNSPAPPSAAVLGLSITGLPGNTDPGMSDWPFGCYVVTVDLIAAHQSDPNVPAALDLSAAIDLDGDGLGDFGYGYYVVDSGPDAFGSPAISGPLLAYPGPDPVGAPGADLNAYDRYSPPGKWAVGNAGYLKTGDTGSQLYLQLRGCTAGDADSDGVCDDADQCPTIAGPPPTGCPICPDITGDHVVDLSDLAILLSNFGLTPATYAQGDINHDNHIDLSDLAAMLSTYGASCP